MIAPLRSPHVIVRRRAAASIVNRSISRSPILNPPIVNGSSISDFRSSMYSGIDCVTTTDTHRTIDAIWRIESPKLVAGLTRIVRDVGLAEDLAQDALVAALEQWPGSGVPRNPGAWLMATAKHRAIDHVRRGQRFDRKQGELARAFAEREGRAPDLDSALDDPIGDDLLRLV